jgi:hypothetical protein
MRILVALLALPCFGMGTCGPAEPPPPDDCAEPGGQPVDGLALGPERLTDRPFEGWAASDTAYITQGAQGGEMLGVSLAVTGATPPPCLAQRTEVRQGDRVLASADHAVNTYDEAGDGTRATSTLWLIFDGRVPALGDELEVTTEAGGETVTSHVTVVANRHRLLALTPTEPSQYRWHKVHFTLTGIHAPEAESFEVELSTAGDTGVFELPATTATIYGPSAEIVVDTAAIGTGELVVRLADQEVRAAVDVISY